MITKRDISWILNVGKIVWRDSCCPQRQDQPSQAVSNMPFISGCHIAQLLGTPLTLCSTWKLPLELGNLVALSQCDTMVSKSRQQNLKLIFLWGKYQYMGHCYHDELVMELTKEVKEAFVERNRLMLRSEVWAEAVNSQRMEGTVYQTWGSASAKTLQCRGVQRLGRTVASVERIWRR